MAAAASSPSPLPHIAVFPFMSKGHTIPLIHLAHLIHRRCLATLTFFTTPLNAPFLSASLSGTGAALVELPFPHDAPDLPAGVESTDRLPSMSLFLPFVSAAEQLQPHFDQALKALTTVTLLISDGFLHWTKRSADDLGIPRLSFYGMGGFPMAICRAVFLDAAASRVTSRNELFAVERFPEVSVSKAEIGPPLDGSPDPDGAHAEFMKEVLKTTSESIGIIVNSFYELEPAYLEYWNAELTPKPWCVGPLCLARPEVAPPQPRPVWLEWLDERSGPVLYVAFGSQAEVSAAQIREIAAGLVSSGVEFLWVVKGEAEEEVEVGERGMVVREWVDQARILAHGSVRGFMSHCGWNSVMEAVSAGVPILALPMMAEQHLNAIFVVEEMGMGLRVRARDGTRDAMVRREDVEAMAREIVTGREKGKVAAEKARELGEKAKGAMGDGGSSWRSLDLMIHEVCNYGDRCSARLIS